MSAASAPIDRAAFPFTGRWMDLRAGRMLAGAGHWPHKEEPERVIGALRAFLAGTEEGMERAPRIG